MGVVVGAEIPMFMAAMIVGPTSALVLREVDKRLEDRIPTGFEMLVNNFTLGIIGAAFAVLASVTVGPIVEEATTTLGDGVSELVDAGLLPLTSILVEPAKVLFLNNAINHGVFGPLGVAESAETGKSILFMIETNPGPGLGVLLAFWVAGPKALRPTVPSAVIIHFFGGIHEIYFPYILMKPKLILAAIAGGMAGVATFDVMGVGLVSTPSPGSIFAYMAQTPRGDHLGVLLGIAVAAVVSFGVASVLLKVPARRKVEEESAAPAGVAVPA
jgi:PTS system mannitol-specific IIC component